MSGNKFGSEKQIQAVTSNLKEDQYLEKTLQTLSLEESYAIKLLQLDHRVIRVNYRRLKERVTKIKSYLNADDIVEFKTLEQEHKMKPLYTQVNLSGQSKIRAAARRLKLEPKLPRRSMSANPKMLRKAVLTQTAILPCPDNEELQRPNSVTGVFIDEPEPETAVRRLSLSESLVFGVNDVQVTTTKNIKNKLNDENTPFRSLSAEVPHNVFTPEPGAESTRKSKRIRPSTTLGVPARENRVRETTLSKSKYEFSSHNLDNDTPRDKSTEETEWGFSPKSTARRWSVGSGESIEAFGPDPHEERRKNLLNSEKENSEDLKAQKKEYLSGVQQFIEEGPSIEPNFVPTHEAIKGIDSCNLKPKFERKIETSKKQVSKAALEQRLNELGLRLESPSLPPHMVSRQQSVVTPRGKSVNNLARADDSSVVVQLLEPSVEPKEELTPFQKQWNEIKKTRYLRARDSQIDFSGVVTMAQDQNKIAKAWKDFTKRSSPFKTGMGDDL